MQKSTRLLLLLAGTAVAGHTQWLSYRDPKIPRTIEGKPNMSADAPKLDGKPDLSGVWESQRTVPLRKPLSKQGPCFTVFTKCPVYGLFATSGRPENGSEVNFAMEPHLPAMCGRQKLFILRRRLRIASTAQSYSKNQPPPPQ
jgi:hypothetical protein